jgi:inorganic triphosphatase YgiF
VAVEREVKLAVPEEFVLPDLDGVAGGVRTTDRGTHVLDATYWDTDALALLHSECGLRHRTRDGSEGVWTFKGPSTESGPAVEREEFEAAGRSESIPAALLDRTRAILGGAALHPVVRVRTERHTIDVGEGNQRQVEVADDRVSVIDVAGRVVARFREVELEMVGEPRGGLVDALLATLVRDGAVLDATPKYVRALAALGLMASPDPTT